MSYLYFDASAGISGDMILGALLDLGADAEHLKQQIGSLNLPVTITVKETKRSSLRATKADVEVTRKEHIHRKWKDIESLLSKSTLSPVVKENSLSIFKKLFIAEAKVHGHALEQTHLHEAGADDAITDIVGACVLLESLRIKKIFCSPINLGSGRVKTSHGLLPVPPPAVAELLCGVPVYSAWVEKELTTPTGAAIIVTLADGFLPLPEIQYDKIGLGAGSRKIPDFPNILRVFYGPAAAFDAGHKMYQIEANIDDANPQILADFIGSALQLGAVDAYLSPIVMKKNRLATKLTVLAAADKLDDLVTAVFRETTSIGVRLFPVERRILERRSHVIEVRGEKVNIKVAGGPGQEINIQPEFSDCLRLAKNQQIPVKKAIELALTAYLQKNIT